MRRFAQIVRVKSEYIDDYEQIHVAVWPEVLATITACNIHNYSIYRHENLLIAYFEYHGTDFEADMQKMADDPKTQEWWGYTDAMQEPFGKREEGKWWLTLKEVFHTD